MGRMGRRVQHHPFHFPHVFHWVLFFLSPVLSQVDRIIALSRLRQSGAFLTTSEGLILQLVRDAAHPRFREVILYISLHASKLLASFTYFSWPVPLYKWPLGEAQCEAVPLISGAANFGSIPATFTEASRLGLFLFLTG